MNTTLRRFILAGMDGDPSVMRFGSFELDLQRYELRKEGARIKLQRVPMDLLVLLIERKGALVTREQIAQRVWGSDVQLDPEGSINTAVRKIRQALDDPADEPKFVETVVGRGYRFVASVAHPPLPQPPLPQPPLQTEPLTPPVPRRSWRLVLTIGILAVAGIGVAMAMWRAAPVTPADVIRLVPFTSFPGSESGPSFSPDGNRVAFSWKSEQAPEAIYIKSIASDSPLRLTSSVDSDSLPAWSPDGRWIAFLRQDSTRRSIALWIVPASGGSAIRVRSLSNPNLFRSAWTPDSSGIVVAEAERTGTARRLSVITREGNQTAVTDQASTGTGDWHAAYSPDGHTLAYLRNTGSASSSWIYSVQVNRKGFPIAGPRLIKTDRFDLLGMEWSADSGSLICATRAELVRIPALGGTAQSLPVLDASSLSIARTGKSLVYARYTRDTDLFRLPGPGQSGESQKLVRSTRLEGAPQYSPDGTKVAFVSERSGSPQVWIADDRGEGMRRLTSLSGGGVGCPRWSPDGKRIALDALQNGRPKIFMIPAEGGALSMLGDPAGNAVRPSWSRNGQWIYFGSDRSGKWEIWKLPSGGGMPVRVTHTGGREAFEDHAGKYLYYTKEKPEEGIWRLPISGGAEEQMTDQGSQGRWAIGERGLYYLNSSEELEVLELPSGRRRALPMYGLRAATGAGGGFMTVGPHDRWILITALVRFDSDLTLVENFR